MMLPVVMSRRARLLKDVLVVVAGRFDICVTPRDRLDTTISIRVAFHLLVDQITPRQLRCMAAGSYQSGHLKKTGTSLCRENESSVILTRPTLGCAASSGLCVVCLVRGIRAPPRRFGSSRYTASALAPGRNSGCH